MKKVAKWLGVFAVLACLCLAMVACGDSETGKYKCSYSYEGDKYEEVIELQKDNKVVWTSKVKGDDGEYNNTENGTYEVKDGKITITILDEDGDVDYTMTGTFKKGKSITLEFEDDDEELITRVYKK